MTQSTRWKWSRGNAVTHRPFTRERAQSITTTGATGTRGPPAPRQLRTPRGPVAPPAQPVTLTLRKPAGIAGRQKLSTGSTSSDGTRYFYQTDFRIESTHEPVC